VEPVVVDVADEGAHRALGDVVGGHHVVAGISHELAQGGEGLGHQDHPEVVDAVEVPVEGGGGDPGRQGDLPDAHVVQAAIGQEVEGAVEEGPTGAGLVDVAAARRPVGRSVGCAIGGPGPAAAARRAGRGSLRR
jgi:hypothetical protein